MRRFLTFALTAAATAIGSLYWLHDGDLAEAVDPVIAEWNAELLARDAGIVPPTEDADKTPPTP